MHSDILFIRFSRYAQLSAQLLYILAQSSEHDAGTCALLVQVLHDVAHTAHAHHRLYRVGVHVGVLHALQNHQYHLHAAPRVEQLAHRLGRHAYRLGYLERIVADGGQHSAQRRCRHLDPHTEAADRRAEGGHLVDGDAALRSHGAHALHEVGDFRGRRGTAGTQAVDGRCNLLHGHGGGAGALDGALLQLLANLLYLARGNGHAHHLRGRLLTHFGQGNHQFVGSLGEALHVLDGLQTELACRCTNFEERHKTGSHVHLLQVGRQPPHLVGGEARGLTYLTHAVGEFHQVTHGCSQFLHGDCSTDVQAHVGLQARPRFVEGAGRALRGGRQFLHILVGLFYLLSQFLVGLGQPVHLLAVLRGLGLVDALAEGVQFAAGAADGTLQCVEVLIGSGVLQHLHHLLAAHARARQFGAHGLQLLAQFLVGGFLLLSAALGLGHFLGQHLLGAFQFVGTGGPSRLLGGCLFLHGAAGQCLCVGERHHLSGHLLYLVAQFVDGGGVLVHLRLVGGFLLSLAECLHGQFHLLQRCTLAAVDAGDEFLCVGQRHGLAAQFGLLLLYLVEGGGQSDDFAFVLAPLLGVGGNVGAVLLLQQGEHVLHALDGEFLGLRLLLFGVGGLAGVLVLCLAVVVELLLLVAQGGVALAQQPVLLFQSFLLQLQVFLVLLNGLAVVLFCLGGFLVGGL